MRRKNQGSHLSPIQSCPHIVLLLVLLATSLLHAKEEALTIYKGSIDGIAYESTPLRLGALPSMVGFIGKVVYKQSSKVASQMDGIVKHLYVDVGNSVKKGAPLLELKSKSLREKISAKKALLNEIDSLIKQKINEKARYKRLLESNAIPLQRYEALEYDITELFSKRITLKAELTLLETNLREKRIYAPFSGVVSSSYVNLGEWVKIGDPIVELLNTELKEVELYLPAEIIERVKLGDIVSIKLASGIIDGKIIAIIPKASGLSHTFPIRVSILKNIELFEGEALEVLLPTGGLSSGILVPKSALFSANNHLAIYLINKGHDELGLHLLYADILSVRGDSVLLRRPPRLDIGDSVLLKGARALYTKIAPSRK